MPHNKDQECDYVVDSLDELFPEGEAANYDDSIGTQPVENNPDSIGGNMGVTVYDENDNKKGDVEYLRVPGEGSVEAYQLDDGSWAVTRRDRLPHNEK